MFFIINIIYIFYIFYMVINTQWANSFITRTSIEIILVKFLQIITFTITFTLNI